MRNRESLERVISTESRRWRVLAYLAVIPQFIAQVLSLVVSLVAFGLLGYFVYVFWPDIIGSFPSR